MSTVQNQPGMFMMPKEFGPCGGPRRRPDGRRFVYDAYIDYNSYGVIAEAADPGQLERLLPPGAVLRNPYFMFSIDWIRSIPWLGGHEYALMYLLVNATVAADGGAVHGQFTGAVWENHVDPILTGREQLGWCKVYCEIDQPRVEDGAWILRASEYGNEFVRMRIDPAAAPQNPERFEAALSDPDNQGMIHFKRMPRAEPPYLRCDADYLALTPLSSAMPEDYAPRPAREAVFQPGSGCFEFTPLTWEQSPCHYGIINALAGLKVGQFLGGFYSRTDAIDDLYDQHIIKQYGKEAAQ